MILSSALIIMSCFGIFNCLLAALRAGRTPLDELILMPYCLLTGAVTFMAGRKGAAAGRVLLYAAAVLPIGVAASTVYFAAKIFGAGRLPFLTFPAFVFAVALAIGRAALKMLQEADDRPSAAAPD